MPPEKRAQWREIMKGRSWYTDGIKEVSLQAGAPPPPGWKLGRVPFLTSEAREKIALAKRGKPLTEEHKRKVGDAHRGQKRAHFDSSWWSSPEGQAHAHKIWITDGLEETRILPSEPIPTGWMRGRMIKGRPAHNKGKPMTEEAKRHLSQVNKGKKLSAETREKISLAGMGRKFSAEVKEKISQSRKGKPMSEETKRHLSEINKGKTPSEETRKKISLAGKGRVLSDETRKKISLGHKARHLPPGVH
jgi:hypothetical protein